MNMLVALCKAIMIVDVLVSCIEYVKDAVHQETSDLAPYNWRRPTATEAAV